MEDIVYKIKPMVEQICNTMGVYDDNDKDEILSQAYQIYLELEQKSIKKLEAYLHKSIKHYVPKYFKRRKKELKGLSNAEYNLKCYGDQGEDSD